MADLFVEAWDAAYDEVLYNAPCLVIARLKTSLSQPSRIVVLPWLTLSWPQKLGAYALAGRRY